MRFVWKELVAIGLVALMGGVSFGSTIVDSAPKGSYEKVCTVDYFVRKNFPQIGRTCDLWTKGTHTLRLNATSSKVDLKSLALRHVEFSQWETEGLVQHLVEPLECLTEKVFYTFRDKLSTFNLEALKFYSEDHRKTKDFIKVRLDLKGSEIVQSASAESDYIAVNFKGEIAKNTSITINLTCQGPSDSGAVPQ